MSDPRDRMRLSPSGPLTGNSQSTPPIVEYVGALFVAQSREGSPGDEIVTSGMTAENNTQSLSVADQPGTANEGQLVPADSASSSFGIGAGVWLFEAEVQCGFTTDAPLRDDNAGALLVGAAVFKNDNTALRAVASRQTALPVPGTSSGNTGFRGTRTQLYQTFISISEQEVSDHGGNFTGFQLICTRTNGINSQVGRLVPESSGTLHLFNGTSLAVRRWR